MVAGIVRLEFGGPKVLQRGLGGGGGEERRIRADTLDDSILFWR